ncbi:MAG: hypothetical protein Q9191_001131 [Dirinaria sp. TL-2023a]
MAPATATSTKWSHEYHSLRRDHLFQNPPTDRSAYPALADALQPHLGSFNALFEDRLINAALQDIGTKVYLDRVVEPGTGRGEPQIKRQCNRLRVKIRDVYLDRAALPPTNKVSTKNRKIFPAECRERHATYRGKLRARVAYRVNESDWIETDREMGHLPIMVKSNRCHLEHCTPAQLVLHKEEAEELGGYFIVNGIEKLIRMLIVPRRNYPMAIIRTSFVKRGKEYSKYGVQIRCVRPDQTSQTSVLHYLNDGNVTFRFSWRRNEYLVPVVMLLKALAETNDREIFQELIGPCSSNEVQDNFITERLEILLRTYKEYGVHGQAEARSYLGSRFRPVLGMPHDVPDYEVGTELLRRVVLVHLGNVEVTPSQDKDKFRMLLFMIKKLYALVAGDCEVDNPDAISSQEILLPGFLYGMILKEKLEEWLKSISSVLDDWLVKNTKDGVEKEMAAFSHSSFTKEFPTKILAKTNENIGNLMTYFLSTGNLVTPTGLDVQQTSGFTVVAEKINFYRFISHFRTVHRGSFFAQLKTTTVRKLLPESWGFLCPVHTPDGSPCGLINHLAHKCKVTTRDLDTSALPRLLAQLGVSNSPVAFLHNKLVVQLDGRIMGTCTADEARMIGHTLRYWKVEGSHNVPLELEVGYIPSTKGGQYPGVYIFSQAARLIRPVKYLRLDRQDFVGPFEQPFMSIACTENEIESGESTHVEYDPTNILSIVANQTPFSDFNQSPRNMYQCQMSKQAMGTPGNALRYRTDNKIYRLQSGQTPVVRPPLYNEYGLDNFPNGTNAIVAVISYTGYDMDDAMILNKSAHERGFSHGTILKTKVIRLDEGIGRGRSATSITKLFGFAPKGFVSEAIRNRLDQDGYPLPGTKICDGDVLAVSHTVTYDRARQKYVNNDSVNNLHRYHDAETAFVEEVRILGAESGSDPCQAVSIKLRVPRSPVIGDKFASRHGQKGVCSQKWPMVDMPFCESGIVPDIIINPHAFPSRMTIGMLVESLAGKSGALHGLAQDSSPWRFDEEHTATDYFGDQLLAAGYNYHGNEPMYSGITGQEFAADIYVGIVFYQRLRHMVNDKFQVRTTGPITQLTGQPIKGRSKGGGIRVGEMERDALLAHGCAFLLQDRLMNCSDYCRQWVCRICGSFLSTTPTVGTGGRKGSRGTGVVRCRSCAKSLEVDAQGDVWEDAQGRKWMGGNETTVVAIPGVLRYLDVELSAMGVRMKFNVGPK